MAHRRRRRRAAASSGPATCPYAIRRDWVANANDSYWLPNPDERLEGYAGIIGCERCERTMRTRMVYRYVQDRLAEAARSRRATLRGHEHENRLMAAEVMRANGDLDTVCDATGETEACAVLRGLGRPLRDVARSAPTSSRSSWPGSAAGAGRVADAVRAPTTR